MDMVVFVSLSFFFINTLVVKSSRNKLNYTKRPFVLSCLVHHALNVKFGKATRMCDTALVFVFLWKCRTHYAAILLNIAVQGANISSSPILTNSTGAELQVIFDSGTTLAYLVEPFYTEFMTAVNFSFFSLLLHCIPLWFCCWVDLILGISPPKKKKDTYVLN
jgi:hypothetical protein